MPCVDSGINGPRCLFTATVSPRAVLLRKQRLTQLSSHPLCSIAFRLQCSISGSFRQVSSVSSPTPSPTNHHLSPPVCCHPVRTRGELALRPKLGHWPWFPRQMTQSWGGLTSLFPKPAVTEMDPDKWARFSRPDMPESGEASARTVTVERDAALSSEETRPKKLHVETLFFHAGTFEALKTAADESWAEPTAFNI